MVSCIPATCFKIVCSACPRVCPAGTHSFPESALFCFILFYFILFSSSLSFFPQGVRLVQETCESGVIHSLDVPGIFRVFMCFFEFSASLFFPCPSPTSLWCMWEGPIVGHVLQKSRSVWPGCIPFSPLPFPLPGPFSFPLCCAFAAS